jgi:hypothetical protein
MHCFTWKLPIVFAKDLADTLFTTETRSLWRSETAEVVSFLWLEVVRVALSPSSSAHRG